MMPAVALARGRLRLLERRAGLLRLVRHRLAAARRGAAARVRARRARASISSSSRPRPRRPGGAAALLPPGPRPRAARAGRLPRRRSASSTGATSAWIGACSCRGPRRRCSSARPRSRGWPGAPARRPRVARPRHGERVHRHHDRARGPGRRGPGDRRVGGRPRGRTRQRLAARERRSPLRRATCFEAVSGEAPFDLVVSNPPYVAPDELGDVDRSVRDFEPRSAWLSEAGAVAFHRRILRRRCPRAWRRTARSCSSSGRGRRSS